MMHSFAWWPTVVVLGVATFTDLRSRRIPNWLVLPFLAAGFAVSGWLQRLAWNRQSLEGAGLALVIYGFLFWMGGMGARGREAVHRDRGLDRPEPVVFRTGDYRHGWGSDGAVLGGLWRISEGAVHAARATWCSVGKSKGGVRDPEMALSNPQAAQDAVRAGHRDRNFDFVFCALRKGSKAMSTLRTNYESSIEPQEKLRAVAEW